MGCNDYNPCSDCAPKVEYDNCGCLDFPSFECLTYYGVPITTLGVTKGMNGEAVLIKIADAITGKQFTKVTTSEMNALEDMTEGDSVFNTTAKKVAVYNGTTWKFLAFE